jgi:ribosomal protein S18 acetylase RimI-like enzyme
MTDRAPHDSEGDSRSAVRVRVATVDDLAAVVTLRLDLLREYGDHPVYGRLRTDAEPRAYDLYRHQLAAPDQAIFLAEHGPQAVGILRCVDAPASPLLHPARYCYVSSVYVAPRQRRAGVLHALLEHADTWARDRGLTEMRLHNSSSNSDAIASWDALGFEVVEQMRIRPVAPLARSAASPSAP